MDNNGQKQGKNLIEKNVFFISSIVFGALISLLYMSATSLFVSINWGDWAAHSKIAEGITYGEDVPPHFLYQILLIGLHWLFDIPFIDLAPLAVLIIVFITFVIAYRLMLSVAKTEIKPWFAITATCFLLISHPVAVLFPYDSHLYFGYIASNVYHNPSILLLKPIALAHFALLCVLLVKYKDISSPAAKILSLALLTVLSIVAKPNYIIALLPALFVFFILKRSYVRDNLSDTLRISVLGVVLPAVLFLVWQYHHFYIAGGNNSIRLGLFEIYSHQSSLWTLLPKLLLSMAFPLSVVIIMKRSLWRQVDFQLAMLMFIVSLVYTYFLVDSVEGGEVSGNFWWSAQISHFILLYVCLRSYLMRLVSDEQADVADVRPNSIYIPLYIAALHFVFGLIWYSTNVVPAYRSW